MGRFINADAFTSTGQGLLGNNMFAYCGNNPVALFDPNGFLASDSKSILEAKVRDSGSNIVAGMILVAVGIYASSKNDNKKPVNLPSKKKVTLDLDHITSGHMPDGPRNPNGNKSVFWGMTTAQVVKAIYEAYSNATKLQTQGPRIRVVGYSESFKILIEMWVNTVEYIIETAYPK